MAFKERNGLDTLGDVWDTFDNWLDEKLPGNTENAADTAAAGAVTASLVGPITLGLVGLGLIIAWKKL